ncbi:MAG: ACT domain-containing protein [Actinobacteria bacterium]|nr:MAG: ACT domain-containing protein [Actinomycetota bacterium]
MATDLSISLPDEPGGLAKAAGALGAAGVNVEGIAGLGGGGHCHVHLLVEDAAAARSALEGAGVTIEGEREAVVVDVSNEDRPGKLAELAEAIAGAGVNLAACYVASRSRVVFSSDDPAALRSALGA